MSRPIMKGTIRIKAVYVPFKTWIMNRPGVAEAVLQTPSSLIDSFIHSVINPFPSDLQNIINPKPLELGS